MINIVLYEPEIPGNTGNIMRTCAGTNTKLHLIEPLGFKDFLSKNQGDFYFLTRYGKKPHTSFDYSNQDSNIYLIFGKESTGIPKEILQKNLDRCLRIPTNANIRSLNLSNCVAIVLFEVLRQQDYPNLLRTEPHKGADYLEK